MPKIKQINNNYTSGIISPVLNSRIDFKKTQNGLESCNNMKVMVEGGLSNRPGSLFSVEVKDSSKTTVLIPFRAGLSGNYVLEFGDLYMRVHKKAGVVVEADDNITAITKANPAVVTCGTHGLSDGDQVYITDAGGMTEINDSRLYYTVANKTATTFEVQDRDGNNVDSTAFTTYTSGGEVNKIFTLTTIYAQADLEELRWVQNQDTLTITHQDYSPRDFKRTSDVDWTITSYMKDAAESGTTLISDDGPYQSINSETTTFTLSGGSYAPGDTPTLTSSAITGINSDTGFQTTDVGRLVRIKDTGGDWGWGEITARASTTSVTLTVKGTETLDGDAHTDWRLGAWSDTTGFPRISTYFQQRQWFFSTEEELDRIDSSAINDFRSFSPETTDDDAISIFLPLNEVNAIYWATGSGSRLRIGTSSQIWSIWGGSDNTAITPTNVQASPEEKTKSKNIHPIDLGNLTLFLNSAGKKLNELFYSFEQDSLITRNLTILSDDRLGDLGDTTDTGVTRLAYQETPYPYIWCIKKDGSLAGLTYAREEGVIGWSDHSIGGSDVLVKSISTLYDDVEDIIFMVVQRTIDGVTRQYVEKLDTLFRGRAVELSKFFDSIVEEEGDDLVATLTLSAVSGSGVTATAGSAVFTSADIGRVIRSGDGRGIITSFTSTSIVVINATDTFSSTSIASGAWDISVNSIDGLDYLEGETVRIIANGGQHPDRTITNGSISLDAQYNKIIIGLDYTKDFQLLKREGGSALSTNIGSKTKISDVYVSFFETVGGLVGTDPTKTDDILMRKGNNEMGKGIEPQTGISNRKPPGGWLDVLTLYYKQPNGLPSTILSTTFKCEVND